MQPTWCHWVVTSLAVAVVVGACSGSEAPSSTSSGGKPSTSGDGGEATAGKTTAGGPARTEGADGQPCYPNGTCNQGLECIRNECTLAEPGTGGASGGPGSGDAGESAGGTLGGGGTGPGPNGGSSGNGGTGNGGSGNGGTAGSGGGGGTAAAGSGGGGGTAAAGSGGTAGGGGTAAAGSGGVSGGGMSSAGQGADGGAGGASGGPWQSAGCGKDAAQALATFVKYTMQTSGVKDANCADKLNGVPKCGAWSIARDYYVWLPPNYDPNHTYPLVLQGTGCGGIGTEVYSLSPTGLPADDGVNGSVIRVGLTPPPNSIGHGTNENQGCYDDKEGNDSVDFVFYENLMEVLAASLCFDKSAVYASGNSTGGTLANELGCKYAGAAKYPIRGIMVNSGMLPNQLAYEPTCTNHPLAGMWVHEVGETVMPFAGNKFAIARAMKVNGCTIGTSFDDAQFDDYPIGGGNPDSTCKKIKGCPADNPLVVCALPGVLHALHDSVVNPGFSTFLQTLEGL